MYVQLCSDFQVKTMMNYWISKGGNKKKPLIFLETSNTEYIIPMDSM